jgi:coniferyl-aldehyde dehydrogenase
MSEDLNFPDSESDRIERLHRIFAAQKAAFAADPYPSADVRRSRLKALKRQLSRYQDLLAGAMSKDFGYRALSESKMFDLLGSTMDLNHLMSHVRRWMKPSRRSTELLFRTNSLKVVYQPKGVAGVIVPWNFPIYLAVGPLAAALAAGNRVMIKMPEATPETYRVFRRLLLEIFPEDLVAVIGSLGKASNEFASQPFDHIIFTGSPPVGRIVMGTAASNLIPVTLELGGKSPAAVTRNYPVQDAARRIVHGKSSNCGQICVAPDYALVPEELVGEFVSAAAASFKKMFTGGIADNPDFTSVVNDRQFARLQSMLEDARGKGAQITICAPYDAARDGRRMPLHIVQNCTPDMALMQEEIFGPLLPVIPYGTLEEAISFINSKPRPLALYCFSHDGRERQEFLRRTHSGGVTFNDWGWHVVNHDAPFGGTGNSGMGTYHGIEGFRELSHAKTVFSRHRFFPSGLFHPPYGTLIQSLILKTFLGRADKALLNNRASPEPGINTREETK